LKALISVSDKTGVVEFARALHQAGVELISTGGTYRVLKEAGLPVRQVSELTGFPEILGGRVKSLHPSIHGAILARKDRAEHLAELEGLGISPIDIVVVNLYPFVETVRRPDATLEEALEQIDIGGPAMIRGAAKNFPSVIVVVDPADYGWVAERLNGITLEERRRLALKAFRHTAYYDAAIAAYLARGTEGEGLPPHLPIAYHKLYDLRYGENPHQRAALYAPALDGTGLPYARQLQGKELSFNNLLDADAAWRAVREFEEPTVVVIKHTNPCGLACHPDIAEAYRRAYNGDPISAFGGIVGFNRPVTGEAAREMAPVFYEVVVAPDYEPEALEVLKKKRNLRLLVVPQTWEASGELDLRPVSGGLLVQTPDILKEEPSSWRTVTRREPTPEELRDLAFAWRVVKFVKSNAIVLAKDKTLVGMGAGQPNRVTSVHLALRVAGEKAKGSVMASDAFFPFPDSIELAAQGGVTAVIQPGGSIRDQEVIQAADGYNISMVFTGIRHFRH
jgi:phosphoribosylaminoimidazolecarboxamide formyltransferase/IMP cyclohydrolase